MYYKSEQNSNISVKLPPWQINQQLSYLFINACLSQNSRIKHASRSIVERPASIIVRIVLFLLLLLLPPFSWSCSRRPRRPFFSNVRINPFMGVVSRIHCLSPILLPGGLLVAWCCRGFYAGEWPVSKLPAFRLMATRYTRKRETLKVDGRTDERILRRPSNDIITSLLPSSFVRVRSTIMENIFDGYLNKQCSEI